MTSSPSACSRSASLEFINRNGVTNLWARRGTAKPLFVLCRPHRCRADRPAGQMDFAPLRSGNPRRHALRARRGRHEILAGRDVDRESKPFVAANPEHPGSIAFLLTSDEEGDATDGTVAVVEALKARGESLDFCIIGEPTSVDTLGDMIKNGRRGSLSGKLTVKGIQCHIAYPHLGEEPDPPRRAGHRRTGRHGMGSGQRILPADHLADFQHPRRHRRHQRHPGSVEIKFNFRFSTASTVESLQQRLIGILDQHGLEYDIAWTLGARPFLTGAARWPTPPASHREICGIETELSTTGGTSDGRFIAEICAQMLEIGPVNATSHKIDECVDITALPKLSAIYCRILRQLLVASKSLANPCFSQLTTNN
jgi:succinyl-diaminopimelate desuccinylase